MPTTTVYRRCWPGGSEKTEAMPAQGQTLLSASDDATAVAADDMRQADTMIPDLIVILLTGIAVLGFLLTVKNQRKEDRQEKETNSQLRLR
jgi:hypothetical protein